jgi:ribulose-phosphate 3-epimerase
MRQLAPSILAADFNQLGRQIKELEENKIELLHIDVMDGMFVPSISFGMPLIASIRKESSLFFDVHLMVQEPVRYIKEFAKAGADSLTVHVEACEDVEDTLRQIKAQGISCGISLNPETPVESILPYLSLVDVVLVMSVHPGFGGQKLLPEGKTAGKDKKGKGIILSY